MLHTFETDPSQYPSPHPHVHLTMKAAGLDGMRLNPRKADLERCREGFVEALREPGIEETTTSLIYRMTHERWRVWHLRSRTTKAKVLDGQQPQTPLPRRQREVRHHYQRVMKTLVRVDREEDRQLVPDLVCYLGRTTAHPRDREGTTEST